MTTALTVITAFAIIIIVAGIVAWDIMRKNK